jgi:hypothetical protein
VAISNTGDIDVANQFFVDLYFDPAPPPIVGTDLGIPITSSVGYMAVSSLSGGATKVLTITSELGFKNDPTTHNIYGMVDSVEQIIEPVVVNNISVPAELTGVIQATPPTPTPVSSGSGEGISGLVINYVYGRIPQYRAQVWLINESTLDIVGVTQTDINGFYEFPSVSNGSYTVISCATVDNNSLVWILTGIVPPDPYADHFLLPGVCSP